ncbi:MAG: hypothetical protein HZA21_02920 [Nitrospirae bacterium]|nr:hypothetical protein [Nitrospirota bacterium]
MSTERPSVTDPDLAAVGAALKRAAANARQLGLRTHTPVYVFKDGNIVDLLAEQQPQP